MVLGGGNFTAEIPKNAKRETNFETGFTRLTRLFTTETQRLRSMPAFDDADQG
ncbi:hypothetical protein Cflav_PD1239 [Pedosphaera parvula Ellin514]|uniref:Uncharacterized protein n=1 Tax=Pedosphaera parvula (strain Ellin514) TaxID=320771 RepID=B9XNT9_PEDPL|nr:hypothetical protein Cflav_PD1239 [Pedosphaera parvula Ellin514]